MGIWRVVGCLEDTFEESCDEDFLMPAKCERDGFVINRGMRFGLGHERQESIASAKKSIKIFRTDLCEILNSHFTGDEACEGVGVWVK